MHHRISWPFTFALFSVIVGVYSFLAATAVDSPRDALYLALSAVSLTAAAGLVQALGRPNRRATDHPVAPLSRRQQAVAATAATVLLIVGGLLLWAAWRSEEPGIDDLRAVLVDRDELPPGWSEVRSAVGAGAIDDDEFCGGKATAHTLLEADNQLTGPPRGSFNAQPFGNENVYSAAVSFRSPEDAAAFLAELERLARSCQEWPYRSGSNPVTTSTIDLVERMALGDDALRIVTSGPPYPALDFIYIRSGRLVASVTNSVQDLPGLTGDNGPDPALTERLARERAQRISDVPQ